MKIIVRLPNWLGDVVMASAFVNALPQYYPDCVIDVIVKKELSGIAELIPNIHKCIPFDKKSFKGINGAYQFGKTLKAEKYDLMFNLPNSISSSLMALGLGAKKSIGFKKEGSLIFLTKTYKKPKNLHRVEEYIYLLEQFNNKKASNKEVRLTIEKSNAPSNEKVLINFNSEASSRRMPVDKALSILNACTKAFPNQTFSFIGAPKEADFVEQIISLANPNPKFENLAGKTNLLNLCHLMAESTLMLTTDSGPAHLANSIALPVIVLFGAGNELNTAPFNKQDLTVIRYGELNCEPCVKNTCKLYDKPKCMEMLSELQIISAMGLYLQHD